MKNIKKLFVAAAMLAGLTGTANAVVIDFTYSGSVVASIETTGNTDFVLNFQSAPGGGAAFINDLFLVGPGGTFSAAAGQATKATASYSATGLGDGKAYNWKLDFPQPNNANRFTVGESFAWSIVNTDPGAWNLNMLHINAFLAGDSIKLKGCVRGSDCGATSVPEPATLGLLGLGLLGVGLARRRRRQ